MPKIKLKKDQPYVPGQVTFKKTRPFWKPFDLPLIFHTSAYELSSGEPVTVTNIDGMGYVTGVFMDHNDKMFEMTWDADGKPIIAYTHEFNRSLQNRLDLRNKIEVHFDSLLSQT